MKWFIGLALLILPYTVYAQDRCAKEYDALTQANRTLNTVRQNLGPEVMRSLHGPPMAVAVIPTKNQSEALSQAETAYEKARTQYMACEQGPVQ